MSVSRVENIKKYMGNKAQIKKHWKKPENLKIKQKYKLAQK